MIKFIPLKKAVQDFFLKRKMEFFILVAGTIMGIYFTWGILEIIFFLVFLWSILGPIQSHYLAKVALFFLILTPIFLLFEQKEFAERVAIYCYYFLVMAVIRAVVEIRSEKE